MTNTVGKNTYVFICCMTFTTHLHLFMQFVCCINVLMYHYHYLHCLQSGSENKQVKGEELDVINLTPAITITITITERLFSIY